ncbi:hypothetical protein TUBRATIS_23420 [Tubulinosema ratisbonensis]|uniref:Uncharacterized protein n=1 Tax=Tubulinosema ratisbonensis TaxID=291195 RepID=A0A437AJ60_9MICR|nr:hypothetical protein TUBRATIS_23420 [Tubulinosema ratisbonensis]
MKILDRNMTKNKLSKKRSNFEFSELKTKFFIFCDNILFLILTYSMHKKYLTHPEVLIFILVNILGYIFSIVRGYRRGKIFDLDEILKIQNFIVFLFIVIYVLFFYFFSIDACMSILYKQLLGEIPKNTANLTNTKISWYSFLFLLIIFQTLYESCKFIIKNRQCNNPNTKLIEREIFDLHFLIIVMYLIYPHFYIFFNSTFFDFIFVGAYIIFDIFLPVIFLKRAIIDKNRKMRLYLHFEIKNFCLIGCIAVILISYLLCELASVNVFILTIFNNYTD